MSQSDDFQEWIKTVMSKVIETFGPDIEGPRYEVDEPSDVLMSTMYYACVKFKNKLTGRNEEHSIILKRPIQMEVWRQMSGSEHQFHNEILFYRKYARAEEHFPRCFYVDEKPPADSIVALENVTKRGYYPCPRKFNAPLEYTLAAIREIGRFHGKGYAMKELQRENFFDIVGQLQDSRYGRIVDEFKLLINTQATRAVDYLRGHDHDVTFCDKAEALLSNAFDEVMMKTIKPSEPLSTLCHGDFALGNILFKEENAGRYSAMLIDFGLFRYSTPVVDLSTYLCLCCSNEIRRAKFSEIMQAYHDALKSYLQDAGVWNAEKYSYDVLLDNFKSGGLFGFAIASFFLPELTGHCQTNQQEILDWGSEASLKFLKEKGGDEISKILADMLLHLKDLDCLKNFL
ncbi:hypothetical protein PUN28_008018 [Cardiocondyla obscurior]|uniref:CHK kinase-like domain-containing protein n=1 Tax=Cardiocondyla obscurior TaxID=286306 RepID=A0AAW2G1X5_9HYME